MNIECDYLCSTCRQMHPLSQACPHAQGQADAALIAPRSQKKWRCDSCGNVQREDDLRACLRCGPLTSWTGYAEESAALVAPREPTYIWYPIDTVPQDGRWVLVWQEDAEWAIYRFGPDFIAELEEPQWTHWRPLPAGPTK